MEKTETKDLNYYKNNCEEDYIKTPISVLRYITELEKKNEAEQLILSGVSQQREPLKAFKKNHIHNFGNTPISIDELDEYIESL